MVVAFDFSELAELALERGIAGALGHPHADLHVLGVLDEHRGLGPIRPHKVDFAAAERAQAEINGIVAARIADPPPNDLHLYIHARIGDPASEILALAAEAVADVIILGTHGRHGVKRWLLGSVAERVVRHARCPVLVVRPPAYAEPEVKPEIALEPACPDCTAVRERSAGKQWWCDEHGRPRPRPHRYSYTGSTVVDASDNSNSILW